MQPGTGAIANTNPTANHFLMTGSLATWAQTLVSGNGRAKIRLGSLR